MWGNTIHRDRRTERQSRTLPHSTKKEKTGMHDAATTDWWKVVFIFQIGYGGEPEKKII